MQIISPSLLAADLVNISPELDVLAKAKETWLHLDVMDGHFVPNLTFGAPIIKKIAKLTSLPLDAHLMVTNPDFHLEEMKDLGLGNVTFHLEAVEDALSLVKKAKSMGFPSVGVSIKPKTPVSDLGSELLKHIDLLLVMSVEPGFGGQKFIPGTWDKLDQIHELKQNHGLNFTVQVDGGINQDNAPKLWEKGVENLVAGSYVFKAGKDHILDRIESLRA